MAPQQKMGQQGFPSQIDKMFTISQKLQRPSQSNFESIISISKPETNAQVNLIVFTSLVHNY